MTVFYIVQFMMGLSITIAASRQTWAFSRDGALPFNAIWFCVLLAVLLGLLTLIGTAAASAVFPLAIAGNNLAWGTPIFARAV